VAPFLFVSRAIDRLTEHLGRVVAWAVVIAILVSAINAVVRKVFGVSSNAWLELQWYLFGAVFMLCAAWTLKDNEHIRIDIVSNRLRQRTRNWIDVFGHIFFLLPFLLVMIYVTTPFFVRAYLGGEMSSNAGGLVIWPAKGLILLGFLVLLLQWASELIKRLAIMRGDLADPHAVAGHHPAVEAGMLPGKLAEAGQPDTPKTA
jgi:TRAP-type mannitol/chloroaromatic compound transport system permease small subunit